MKRLIIKFLKRLISCLRFTLVAYKFKKKKKKKKRNNDFIFYIKQ